VSGLFVEFLTDPGDIVLHPFAGSNTTGYSAERLGRCWAAVEIKEEFGEQSLIRLESLKS
jgi:DNA modification methylase